MANFPVTAEQYDRYQRRARARVFWGHRTSGILESLERKGVRRKQANEIVGAAVREYSGQMTLSALFYAAASGLAGAVALILQAPQVLRGEAVGSIDLAQLSIIATPFALIAGALALIAGSRFVRAVFR